MSKDSKPQKGQLRINLEYCAFISAVYLINLVPLRISYMIAEIFGNLVFMLDFKHKRRVVSHIMHSGIVGSLNDAKELGRKNFIHFAKLIVEIVVSRKLLKKEKMQDILTISGPESTKNTFFNPGKSSPMILICAHFGNWEFAGQAYTLASGIPLLSVMRPFDNPKIGEYIVGSRAGGMHTVCDKKGAIRPMLTQLKEGKSVAFLVDQHAQEREGVLTTFFGHPARTHSSPALLHFKTGVPIVMMLCRKVSDNFKFEFIVEGPITVEPSGSKEEDIKNLMQKITYETEKVIRRYPEQWMWAHRRWLDINREKKD